MVKLKAFIILLYVALPLFSKAQIESDSIFNLLWEGNKRFYTQRAVHPHMDIETIKSTSNRQKPIALVFTCSDSRVIPESIFDVGIGDLFVVRIAGNIVENGVLGSVEYAVNHLDIHHIVVLGHTHCGAIKATVEMSTDKAHIGWLVNQIRPAYQNANKQEGDLKMNTTINNVCNAVSKIITDKRNFIKNRNVDVKIISALYHVEDGHVEFLDCNK